MVVRVVRAESIAEVHVGIGKVGDVRRSSRLHGRTLGRLDLRHQVAARLVQAVHLALELRLELVELRVQFRHALLR